MKKEIKVLTTLNLSPESQARIREASELVNLTVLPAKKSDDIPAERWAETEVLFTQDVLPQPDQVPNLQWVQFNSAGVDPYLDHPIIRDADVKATTMSGVITDQIAEYVLMAMLAFGHKLPKLFRNQQNKKWLADAEKKQALLPVELRDSTVGILGYGSIGRQVAYLLQPFGATVLASKKQVMQPEDHGYAFDGKGDPHGDLFDRLYPIEALHSLLKASDFVVLSLPLTASTRHIMDSNAFSVMKPTAYLVNVGRGELIDQPALVNALKAKQFAGAALDVFKEEPLPETSPLWEMDNVILTPHISGMSRRLPEETLSLFIENLNRYMTDLPLVNQVDVERGY